EEGIAFLKGLLDGSVALDGLAVDADLRWALVIALARVGAAGEPEIDVELDRDDTISGRQQAAAARAAQPYAAAKEQAWNDAAVRDDVPNETQRMVAASFQRTGQDEVLLPYADRYLELAGGVWETKGTQLATTILTFLFPRGIPTREVADKVDAWPASTDANPAARRLVSEGRADLERALRGQERDARA
ncbi:MAG: ERAP1-like C-terminal domain-containing protein, partial [Thermocrispum sp.]